MEFGRPACKDRIGGGAGDRREPCANAPPKRGFVMSARVVVIGSMPDAARVAARLGNDAEARLAAPESDTRAAVVVLAPGAHEPPGMARRNPRRPRSPADRRCLSGLSCPPRTLARRSVDSCQNPGRAGRLSPGPRPVSSGRHRRPARGGRCVSPRATRPRRINRKTHNDFQCRCTESKQIATLGPPVRRIQPRQRSRKL